MALKKNTRKKIQKPKTAKARKPASSGSWLKAFVIALVIVCVVRLFMYQTYAVSSSSMSSTLIPGDWVLINKMAYGARTPITPISLPFAPVRYQASSPKLFLDWIKMPYFRLPGFSKIKRNDIVACNYPLDREVPLDKKIMYLKRIVAISGDTLQLQENRLFVNHIKVEFETVQHEYRVLFKTQKIPDELIKKYNLKEGSRINNFGEYSMYLTETVAKELDKEPKVRTILQEKPLGYLDQDFIFPFLPLLNWSIDNYGPLIVPKKGQSIPVNENTVNIYRSVIVNFEGNTLEIKQNQILINNLPVQNYIVKNNYYFVLDDNRDNPKDSRLWGFLPESHIVGKANFILASFDPSARNAGMRWNRIMKKIE